MLKVAVFTMIFNESRMLPIWRRHYGKQVGEQNCFVIDHGSTDGSTDDLGLCNRLRLPRSPQDNDKRTAFVGDVVSSFLKYYDYVIYTDCDEMLVADPARFTSIPEFLESEKPEFVTSIGLDVLHRLDEEGPIDLSRPISEQRGYVHYSSAMNKLSVTSVPVCWTPGFHSGMKSANFGGLYLFHLRYFDLESTLKRLSTTRDMPWLRDNAGQHQRISDETMVNWVRNWNTLPVVEDDLSLKPGSLLGSYANQFKATEKQREAAPLSVDTTLFGSELIRLPAAFKGAF